jgi:phthalate 4,5-dioxygenase oxygenase subunit
MLVPVDDTNCMFYWIAWHETKGITAQAWRSFCDAVPGVDVDPVTYRKVRNLENDYLQDRAKMKAGDFTGITGIPTQDMAMWESMGPIADRSHDKLGSSDRAIVEFRKIMLQQAMEADSEPPAKTWRNADLFTFEGMVAKQDDWREVRPEAPVPA